MRKLALTLGTLIPMKRLFSNHFLRGAFFLLTLFSLRAPAQPSYVNRVYPYYYYYSQIKIYDSVYIIARSRRLVKLNFAGDTLRTRPVPFSRPFNHAFKIYKTLDNNILCVGMSYNFNNNMVPFIAKINLNLDTLWVRYYDDKIIASGTYFASTTYSDTVIITYLRTDDSLKVLTLDTLGNIIDYRVHPKPSYSKYIYSIDDIAAVNSKEYLIVFQHIWLDWYQQRYISPNIYISKPDGLLEIHGTSASPEYSCSLTYYIFYNSISQHIKLFEEYNQYENWLTLYQFNLNGDYIGGKDIYCDNAQTTNEGWDTESITQLSDGNFVIGGGYDSPYYDPNTYGAFMLHCGPNGEWHWFRKYMESSAMTYISDIAETPNHFLAAAGRADKAWLMVVDSLGCEAPNLCWVGQKEDTPSAPGEYLTLWPNPAQGELFIHTAQPPASLEIYSVQGQCMYAVHAPGDTRLHINLSSWPAGLYLLKATDKNGTVTTRKFIKTGLP
jgi:hypothetical protein